MTMKFSSKVAVALGLMAGFQLTASTSYAKSVNAYISEDGLEVADAYKTAKADCAGDAACEAQIPKDLLAAGVTATDIMIAAVGSGADPAYVVKVFSKAAIKAGINADRITKALLSITRVEGSGFTEADIISGMVQASEESNNSQYTAATVVASARAAGVSIKTIITGLQDTNATLSSIADATGLSTNDVAQVLNDSNPTAGSDDSTDGGDTTVDTTELNNISNEIVSGGNSCYTSTDCDTGA